ncbi:MAG: DNA/RNA non-specific endonuclease [Planctomycetaceae bacterium]
MNPSRLESIVRSRIDQARSQVMRSMECIARGNPLGAEPSSERLMGRIARKLNVTASEARRVSMGIRAMAQLTAEKLETLSERTPAGPEAIWGDSIDFVDVSFLARGVAAAKSVARVAFLSGQAQGTGFMVSDRLFLTNHHVIESKTQSDRFKLEFGYERDANGTVRETTAFRFDPSFFLTDSIDGLDFTLIGVGQKIAGSGDLASFGWNRLSGASDKHALGEVANIIQHPDGRLKEVVLRENRLVSRLDFALHYIADTEPGSSGSPVFNNDWEVIALHHWGGPWRERPANSGPGSREINEGIRISAIVEHLRNLEPRLPQQQRSLLAAILERESRGPVANVSDSPMDDQRTANYRMEEDGRVTWQIPVEFSVRMPWLSPPAPREPEPIAVSEPDLTTTVQLPDVDSEASVKPSTNYSRRSGYKPDFIDGFTVPLPKLTAEQKEMAAPNQQASDGDDPFELKYHHFSVVMNGRRRLAFFAACNMDGATAKHVDRRTGDVSDLEPNDSRLESLAAEGAEASDKWYDDDRVEPEEYAGADVYESQIVPGFPDPRSRGRMLRMFQRGHLVRRMDPAWGNARMAKLADADTFHWTNCSPQVGMFNMGQAPRSTPDSGGGKLWRAAENYVLRNAVADQQRVCCITGPVFRRTDRRYRSIRVPGQFWKVIVWASDGELRSIALLLDQRPVIEVWPETMGQSESLGAEAFGDSDEISSVEDFLSTITEIEQLTKLDFGKAVRDADVRGGESLTQFTEFDDFPLKPQKTSSSRSRRGASRR